MRTLTIAGGGLSGCLLLAALKHRWPDLSLQLMEKSVQLCGEHTWSFHHDDVPAACWPWLDPLISKKWPGYEVFFPKHHRKFDSPYYSIKSRDLAQKITTLFPQEIHLKAPVSEDQADFLAMGWPARKEARFYGFQKFVGLEIKTEKPHGLKVPILKDVRQAQTDGYRFFYVLPFSENELLIEDTYYSNSPDLDQDLICEEIKNYANQQGWKITQILKTEKGSLPLDLYGFEETFSPLALGAAAGLAHPVTGYTLPAVLQQIQSLLEVSHPDLDLWKKQISVKNQQILKPYSYYRFLNRMMFKAATPSMRYKVLERFYTLPEDLIQRFYGGRTTLRDEFRILLGKPPVPILKAVREFSDLP